MPAGIGFGVGISLDGDKALIRKLERLGRTNDRARKKVIRQAVSAAMTPVNKAAKAKAPIGKTTTFPGLLKKSLGKKAKTYGGTIFVVVIGPRFKPSFRKPTGKVSKKGKPLFQNPAKYAHLVELGTSHSAPHPFLRPALFENKGRVVAILRTKLASGIIREAKKK